MAARVNRIRHDDETRPYVYCLKDGEAVCYVGKGTGRRLEVQKRKHRLDGVVLERCKNETEAFKRERHYIQVFRPFLNRCAGGNGGRRKKRGMSRSNYYAVIEGLGSRVFSARLLLAVAKVAPHLVTIPLEELRRIAYPPTT